MSDLGAVLEQLKQERDKLDRAIEALSGVVGNGSGRNSKSTARRTLSLSARQRIAAAQRARWAKQKASNGTGIHPKRVLSVAARKRIAAAQRARWAKFRKAA